MDAEKVETEMDAAMVEQAIAKMNRFFSARERSSGEVIEYLQRKGTLTKEEIAFVVERLKFENLIDDVRFSKNRLDYRSENGYGPLYIRNELSSFKVSEGIVRETLDGCDPEAYIEAAVSFLEKKLPRYMREENSREKLQRLLLSRGYVFTQIEEAIRRLAEKFPHWGSANVRRNS